MEKLKNKTIELLRWSEKYTKTDMVYLAKGGFWLTFGQTIASLSVFILSILFANLVSKEDYGIYKYIIAMSGIISSLSLSGLGTAVVQATADGHYNFLKKAFKTSIRWSALIIIPAIIISIYYFLKSNYILSFSFLIVSIFMPITNAFGLYGSFWSGKQNFKKSTLFFIVTQIILVGSLSIAILFKQNVSILILLYFGVSAVSAIIGYIHTQKTIRRVAEAKPDTNDHEYLKYGTHLSAIGVIDSIAFQIDKILIFQFLGAAPVAIYSFAQAIPEQLKGSFKNIFALALPKYSSSNNSIIKKSVFDKILRLTILSLIFAVAYILAAPFIFEFLFPKYIDSVKYSQIYMLGFVAVPSIMMASTYFRAKKNTRILYLISAYGNISSIILMIILVAIFGVIGVVIEKVMSMVAIATISLYYLIKERDNDQIIS